MADAFTYGGVGILTALLDTVTWYGAWGTGAAAATRSDTTMTEGTEDRVAVSGAAITVTTTTFPNDTVEFAYTMTCNATAKTIAEAGMWSAAAAGTLIFRSSFTGVAVTNGNTIGFKFKLRCK